MSDEDLWNHVPPVTQRRALNVAFNVGCPQHGQEVFRRGGHYPWIMSRERPFKVECPVGGEVYPTNDFVPWHHGGGEGAIDTTQPYVDDGTGYIGPDGQRYHFVAHYIFWQRWRREIVPALGDLRDLYLLTEDKRYARAAAILLARIATDYPESDYARQAVHRVNPPHGIRGGILDYIWENAAIVSPAATAFDAILPVLVDPEVVGFLHRKGITDVRRHIEDRLLFELVNRITRGRDGSHENRIWGNFGMYQRSMAILAVVLDNDDPARGLTSDEMVEWILRPGRWDEVGQLEEALWNRFYRDGHGGEASPAYSAGTTNAVSSVAQILERRGLDFYRNPKMARLVDAPLDMAVLGKWTPSIGDTGDIFGSQRLGWYRNILLPAFQATGNPRWAKALVAIGIEDNQLWENVPMEAVRKAAEEFGKWPVGGTRLLGGYGLAIAESRTEPVGLALYYGYAGGGHGHRDRLNIEMFAFDRPVLPQHGYPTPLGTLSQAPKRFYWTSNTLAQYCVTVNRKGQQTVNRGRLNLLASTPTLQVIDASADEVAYPGVASLYRRTSLLIENPDGLPYLVDIFRVAGGWEHAWSFHGPPFAEFETFGLDLGPVRENGTLAGENVPFGGRPQGHTDITSGFQYLFNVRRAPSSPAPWGAIWSQPDEDIHLSMTMLAGGEREIVVADAEPELRPNHPKTMPYLLAFNGSVIPGGGSGIRSDFVAVVEAYEGKAGLGEMGMLDRQGPPHGVAVLIRRASGVDFVVSHLSAEDESSVRLPGDRSLSFGGEVAHLAIDSGELSRASLLNAKNLRSSWLEVESAGMLRGRIAQVDYARNLIVLDQRIAGAEALVGQTVIVGNAGHRTAFQVADVAEEDGNTVLHFGEMPMIVGLGQVERIEDSGIATSTEFGFLQVDGGNHDGRRLLNVNRERGFLIRDRRESTFRLDANVLDLRDLFSEEKANEKNRFWIAETGPGDEWELPGLFAIEKLAAEESPGAYRLTLNSAVRVALRTPNDAPAWVFQDAAGEWRPLPVSHRDGMMRFELSPEQLAHCGTVIRPAK